MVAPQLRTMDDYLILDILLGLIVVLFAAIGCWRGAAKEVVVTAGIFAGYALASSWARPWGGDLSDLTDLRVDVAQLLVAATAILAATIILGYGGSALAGSPDVRLSGRLAGAALAAINGGLLLHYCLSFIERFLTDEGAQRALDRSHVSRLLLRQFGWMLIGAAGIAAAAIVVSLLARRRGAVVAGAPAPAMSEPAMYQESPGRQRPARLPRGADDGKYEPVARGFDPASGRYLTDAPSVRETIPLPPVDATNVAYGAPRGTPSVSEPGAAASDRFSGDEWYRRAEGGVSSSDAPLPDVRPGSNGQTPADRLSPHAPADLTQHLDPEGRESGANGHGSVDVSALSWIRRSAHPGWLGDAAPTASTGGSEQRDRQCRACGANLGEGDSFCPRCGSPA
jgi:hypothetical protein